MNLIQHTQLLAFLASLTGLSVTQRHPASRSQTELHYAPLTQGVACWHVDDHDAVRVSFYESGPALEVVRGLIAEHHLPFVPELGARPGEFVDAALLGRPGGLPALLDTDRGWSLRSQVVAAAFSADELHAHLQACYGEPVLRPGGGALLYARIGAA